MINKNVEILINEIVVELGNKLRDIDKKEVLELVDHNECQIAMETLCTQLYEFETMITTNEFKKLEALNNLLHLHSKYCERLRELIV